jgi:hypothetical protein
MISWLGLRGCLQHLLGPEVLVARNVELQELRRMFWRAVREGLSQDAQR